ncbi:MAG: hypothetical protein ACRYGP_22855 [Janthinobacterium lividum]
MVRTWASLLRRPFSALLWASLLPLMYVFRPYGGIVQDAWIYIGRGLADRDPAGLGQDILFTHDAQTGFSLFRPIVRMLLAVLPATAVSEHLVLVGLAAWFVGAAALMRRIASGRVAWVGMMAILVMPPDYGGFEIFHYAEAIATPRVFAEAAVLFGLAKLLDGRHLWACGFLAMALLLHPLMAFPGLALAGLLLVTQDRRWLVPIAVAAAALLAAAAHGVPVLGRLFVLMDPTWFSLVRHRSLNLFPSLWPAGDDARIVCLAAAAIVAGSVSARPARTLLYGGVVIAGCGLGAALVFGDVLPSVLITQLQPWRALWLLTFFGNAGLAIAAVKLWRADPGGRVTLALLVMAWAAESSPILAMLLAVTAVTLRLADRAGRLPPVSPKVASAALGAALLLAALQTVGQIVALVHLYRTPDAVSWQIGAWSYVLASGVLVLPIMAGAVAGGLASELQMQTAMARRGVWLASAVSTLAFGLAAFGVWDGRTAQNRSIEAGAGTAELDAFLGEGSGEVFWIGDRDETWFLLGRPAFMNVVQGAPILFSRDLALEWADRANLLIRLRLVRPADLTLAPDEGSGNEIRLADADLLGFCADRRHPSGLVAPGDQLDAVPAGLSARLWTPPFSFQQRFRDATGPHWRAVSVFTLVHCATFAGESHHTTP